MFLHTLGLLSSSREVLGELCKSIVSIHTDYGTEKGISRVEGCCFDTFLPYMHVPLSGSQDEILHQQDRDLFVDEALLTRAVVDDSFFIDDARAQGEETCLESAFEGPDMNHVIHNATNNLEDVCDCYGPFLKSLKALCALLSGRESKQQVIETCFNSPHALPYQDNIRSFSITVHEKRWNTIAVAIQEVHDLEPALKRHWKLTDFLGSSNANTPAVRPSENNEDYGVNLQAVDEAIHSDYFWGSLRVLLPVARIQSEATKFVNGCPCHTPFEGKMTSKEFQDLSDRCPLKGRRCPELASGDFFQLLQTLFEIAASRIELELPKGLSKLEVAQLMKDFEKARQHLLTTYVLKLTFWSQPPFLLAGIAHWDPAKRVECVRKCLDSTVRHPKLECLRENVDAAHEFIEGGGLWHGRAELQPLMKLACELRLMYTSAWRVEGQHARTKRAAERAPHHSAAYTSLAHRLPELKAYLGSGPEAAAKLAKHVAVVTNGRVAAKKLGFSEQVLLKCGWISPKTFQQRQVGFSVIYHDDPYCKYTLPLPKQVKQQVTKRRTLLEDELPGGSLHLRSILALKDVRNAIERNAFITLRLNTAKVHGLQALLGPCSTIPAIEDVSSSSGSSERLNLGLICDLEGGVKKPGIFADDRLVVASITHEQPSRFHRTHVDEEVSLAGFWLIQLHKIMKLNTDQNKIIASLQPVNLGETSCEQASLTLHVSQLSLEELCALRVWEQGPEIGHVFESEFMSTVPSGTRQAAEKALDTLMKCPEGLAITPDLSTSMVEALDMMCGSHLLSGPPWKLTNKAHEHLVQTVVLQNGRNLLSKASGPWLEASAYQLILALDDAGWTHEVVTKAKHKALKQDKYVHEAGVSESKVWFTVDGCSEVNVFYLLALLHLREDAESNCGSCIPNVALSDVPYGLSDNEYRKLLGLQDNKERCGGRRERKPKLCHVGDDVWPEEKIQPKRKKPLTKRVPKKMKTDVEVEEATAAAGEPEGDAKEFEFEGILGSCSSSSSSTEESEDGGVAGLASEGRRPCSC